MPRAQWAALEADLLVLGYAVADIPHRLSWRQLASFVEHAGPETKVFHAANPDGAPWTAAEHRAADVADLLRAFLWVYGRAHGSTARQPEPLPRPYTARRLPVGDEQVGSRVQAATLDVVQERLTKLHQLDAVGGRRFTDVGKVT